MKTKDIILIGGGIAVTAALALIKKNGGKLGPLVPNQRARPCDPDGCGYFGASRGSRLHQGLDIIITEGQEIMSPINGEVVRFAFPYEDRSYAGLAIQNEDYFIKIFYMAPTVQPGTSIRKGQVIGLAQNVQRKFGPEMTPHVHIEVWDKKKMSVAIDPAKLF
jgi:murein DD-endopeptidase MepM/ murein hydrolase activator NlpD